jgi:RNA polymerase sigma-70 factor (ECF subfamily)
MEKLCATYWIPLYVYLRSNGNSRDRSEELLQEFFLVFLEKDYVYGADSGLGKFRTYLLTALNRFISKTNDKAHTIKRGGNVSFVRMDIDSAERVLGDPNQRPISPETAFDRQWAIHTMDVALEQLEMQYEKLGKHSLFLALKPILASPGSKIDYGEASIKTNMAPAALRVAVHRLKNRYRDCILDVIKETVDSSEKIERELNHLFEAVSGQ